MTHGMCSQAVKERTDAGAVRGEYAMLLCGGTLQGELPSGAVHCLLVFFNVGVDTTTWWKCTMRSRLVGRCSAMRSWCCAMWGPAMCCSAEHMVLCSQQCHLLVVALPSGLCSKTSAGSCLVTLCGVGGCHEVLLRSRKLACKDA